ncbi:hypothetical protein Tco_0892176 [Tanacetum coccineum]|uniref:Uncharacterized protein n=1 Tax=Tanacetum coccineum TaxID=301880 RepID=A0ABQ5CB57_9ASTR
MSDMTACLNDLNYIPLNNEQNEPTQGDIGETSNDPTQAGTEFPDNEIERSIPLVGKQSELVQIVQRHVHGHGVTVGGDDRPPSHTYPTVVGAWGTPSGPVSIRFEFGDRETLMPLGEHAAHWANYLGELVRELPLHYPSWRQCRRTEGGVMSRIGMESSATREYPSLNHTFILTHTVNGVFLNPEDKALYEEMLRLQGLGSNTETGVPYTEDEIMAIVRGGKQRGHIPGVGRVLPGQGTVIPPPPPCTHSSDVVKLKKREKVLTRQVNMFMKLFRSDDKFSQMLTQLESQPEIGGGSGSGGRGDDEQGDDEDDGEDGEDEDDS